MIDPLLLPPPFSHLAWISGERCRATAQLEPVRPGPVPGSPPVTTRRGTLGADAATGHERQVCLEGRTCVLIALSASPLTAGNFQKGFAATMTVDTQAAEAPPTYSDTPEALVSSVESTSPESTPTPDAPVAEGSAAEKSVKAPAKKAAAKKSKTLELTLTVTGTADGEWRAELKQGTTYLARNLAVAATAVSRAAQELHTDFSAPIDEVIEEARAQQAARVATLEAELEAARKALAGLD